MKFIKLLIILLFTFFQTISNAQDTNPNSSSNSLLPNITPPSPESFQMTKYGDIPVDEFNGKVNLNIPLCEFISGKLSLPINLTYNGAGVKVKDISNQVGINWNLNAGGLITREIRDIADEARTRINLTPSELGGLNQPDCTNEAAILRGYIDTYQNDTEADMFHFNFNGYSGSFFLDSSFKPKLTKNDNELKIEILGSLYIDKKIVITDITGIKYYFGGNDATEGSTVDNISNGVHSLLATGGITSFYLYKIEHPLNGVINIEYETKSNYRYVLNSEFTHTQNRLDVDISNEPICTHPQDSYSSNILKNYISNPRYIKRISSPNNSDEITFNRLDLNSTNLDNSVRSALKSIILKKNSIDFQKIVLDYIGINDLNNVARFFLTEVVLNDLSTDVNKKEKYSFEYNSPLELPNNRLSFKIDKLGYFNNKNNQNLNPCFPSDYQLLCPNRSSDFYYASMGVLKKVIYPTKGYTEFEYEEQPVVEKKFTTISGNTYSNNSGAINSYDDVIFVNGRYNKLQDVLPKTIILEDGSSQNLFSMPLYTQDVDILLSASTTDNEPTNRMANVTMKITDLTTMQVTTKTTAFNLSFNYSFNHNHNYKIELSLQLPNIVESNATFGGNFSFNLHTGFHTPTGFGVRLKRTKNFATPNANPETKRFYYKPYHKLDDIRADNLRLLPETKSTKSILVCPINSPFVGSGFGNNFYVINHSTRSSEYNFLDFTNNDLIRDYSNVCVSFGGDNFENGGIEKTFGLVLPQASFNLTPLSTNQFTIMLDPNPVESIKPSNSNPINGMTINEKNFKNINGTIYKTNEKQFIYEFPISSRKINFYGNKIFNIYSFSNNCAIHNTLSNYSINYYYCDVYDIKKIKEIQIEYIDHLPASLVAVEPNELNEGIITYTTQDQLEAPYKKIITTQTFEYGTLKGLPTTITTSTSESGVDKKTVNTYVNTAATLPNIPTTQSVLYTSLINQNRVATPVQVQQFENTTLLSTQRTLFKKWNNNNNHILPELIQTSKGINSLEDRAVFTEYDTKGNPTVFSLKDGTKTKYFYNANSQVIMKVENFLTTQNIPANPTWTNACTFIAAYPTASITIFNYDSITNQIVSVVSPNCDTQYYIYDAMHRLKFIKDNAGNIVKEFDQNYKN